MPRVDLNNRAGSVTVAVMGPTIFSCFLCGFPIYNPMTSGTRSWLRISHNLEFHYDTTHGPAGAYKLGSRKAKDVSEILEFPIDGAGGELIEILEVTLQRYEAKNAYSFLKHGKLNSVKITTNRKRSFHVGSSPDGATLKTITTAPGTTLTGLYASQVGADPTARR
ncbi:MAG: hypothetical protein M1840_004771 [Geoglossum simile]|nr:MAG: hypothetical protein M1840_004771 [Geoglossum simile]